MKKSQCLMLILTVLALPLADAAAETKDETEVLAAVQSFIDGMKAADGAKVRASVHPHGRFVTLRRDPQVMQSDTPERVATMVAQLAPGEWDNRLHDVEIRVDDTGIATVWARYEFFIDGKRSHCGRALFQLYRTEGKWTIVNFADTNSVANCT